MPAVTERKPVEPRARAAFEQAEAALARTKQDQAAASAEAKAEFQLKQSHAERDRQMREAAQAAKAQRDAATKAKQKKARDEYMALPLTDDEKAELEGLEVAANGPGNAHPDMMRRLRDLRAKAKNKAKKEK